MEKCYHLATSFSEMELPGWKFLVNKKNILDHSFWAYLPILGGGACHCPSCWFLCPCLTTILVVTAALVLSLWLALGMPSLFSVVISQLVWLLLRQINWRATALALEVKFPEIHRLSRKEFDFNLEFL